ncbi:hypothetical protein D3C78_1276760 [compost metagenome]
MIEAAKIIRSITEGCRPWDSTYRLVVYSKSSSKTVVYFFFELGHIYHYQIMITDMTPIAQIFKISRTCNRQIQTRKIMLGKLHSQSRGDAFNAV